MRLNEKIPAEATELVFAYQLAEKEGRHFPFMKAFLAFMGAHPTDVHAAIVKAKHDQELLP